VRRARTRLQVRQVLPAYVAQDGLSPPTIKRTLPRVPPDHQLVTMLLGCEPDTSRMLTSNP
jgi:hypothetical protein